MKILSGKVIGKKMQKTATVEVERVVVHPLYKKRFKKVRKYQVQDDLDCKVGQKVQFCASKRFSKTKKWNIIKIIEEKKERKEGKK